MKRRFSNPVEAQYLLRARLHLGSLINRYQKCAQRQTINKLYLVVSLDCDTDEDIAVVSEVHTRLIDIGVKPVYAVPGALLERGSDVYREIASDKDSEFLNHGAVEHTIFDAQSGKYRSTFFYDQISPSQVEQDIRRGHELVQEVLGVAPRGFRTPHFGTYQTPRQLRFLHGTLSQLGYSFSTSTVPLYGYRYGPIFRRFGLPEFPVSGQMSAPLEILDSWACFAAPDRTLSSADYVQEGRALGSALSSRGVGILNYYVDPSHIWNSEAFFETVKYWCELAAPVTYSELLGLSPERHRN